MCVANLAVILGTLSMGPLVFFSSGYQRGWHGLSATHIVLHSPSPLDTETKMPRLEPLQQARRPQRPMECATKSKFYSGTVRPSLPP